MNESNENRDPIRVEAMPGTPSDGFYLDRGQEMRRQTLPLLNDVLQKLIVLNTALLGIFVGIKEIPLSPSMRVAAIVCFLGSLTLAFFGVYPREWVLVLDDPTGIREQEDASIKTKSSYLRFAAFSLVIGFVFGAIGFVAAAF